MMQITLNWSNVEADAARALIALAFPEDLGTRGDVTSAATIPATLIGAANFVARSPGVVAGIPIVGLVAGAVDSRLKFHSRINDGAVVRRNDEFASISGPMRSLLSAERIALNFLQRLSGIATLTHEYVTIVGSRSQVLDTRKTTPGWRILEKYAVRCGGGHNHRIGLFDGVLIKDNHLAALGGGPQAVHAAIAAARKLATDLPIEVEVDSVELFEAALIDEPVIILLDNMSPSVLTSCVARRNAVAPPVLLEASGGITLATIKAVADSGVDRISIGALTHSAPALDIALDYHA